MHGVRALGTPQEPCRCSEHTGCYQADRAVSYLQARHQRAALVRATNALRAGGRIAVQGGPQLHAPRVHLSLRRAQVLLPRLRTDLPAAGSKFGQKCVTLKRQKTYGVLGPASLLGFSQ